jgi:acetyl-CoA carboxylase carboxyl transferase subunit beta
MRGLFHRGDKFRPVQIEDERALPVAPDGLWVKCPKCGELVYSKEIQDNLNVCPKCGHHLRMRARDRINLIMDDGSFTEWDAEIRPEDPLDFADESGTYVKKLAATAKKSGENEALISGHGTIDGRPLAITVADFDFLGASMGSVFGEKLARAAERCADSGTPILTVSASGGARMHEGLFSLMQMAKTTAALSRLGEARVPHFALLTDPCYGGVTASYATVADVIMAEPEARVGFAGPRVFEQITKQKLPPGFQTAEFLIDHGMIDLIVARENLRDTIVKLIDHHRPYVNASTARPPKAAATNGTSNGNGNGRAKPGKHGARKAKR